MENNNDKAKKMQAENIHKQVLDTIINSGHPGVVETSENTNKQSQWNDPEMMGQISVNDVISHSPDKIFPPSDLELKLGKQPPIDTSMGIIPETKNGAEIQYDPKASLKIDEIEMIEPKQPSYDTTSMDIVHPSYSTMNSLDEYIHQYIAVKDYCQQNNIQPQDLIDCYSEHHTLPPKE